MFILASNLFRKRRSICTYLRLDIHFVCGEFLAFKYIFFIFFKINQNIVHQKSSKLLFKIVLFLLYLKKREKRERIGAIFLCFPINSPLLFKDSIAPPPRPPTASHNLQEIELQNNQNL